jgi:hypothetical protein
MAIGTATREDGTVMVGPTTIQIEYKGGEVKHLHLTKDTALRPSKNDGTVTWNVEIIPDKPNQRIPDNRRPTEVRVWCPLPGELFSEDGVLKREIAFGPFDYSDPDNVGRASKQIAVNEDFPLVDNQKTVVPLAIYTDIDEGQGPDPTKVTNPRRKGEFKQPGRQMVDGAHSHPECEVGP